MACAIKKGVNYECAHSHLGEVRSSHQGPRLPPPSRINGAYLPGLWLPEMVGLRGTGPDPVYQQRPADFLDVPCLRHRGVSEATMQNPDAKMRRGNEMGCLTS